MLAGFIYFEHKVAINAFPLFLFIILAHAGRCRFTIGYRSQLFLWFAFSSFLVLHKGEKLLFISMLDVCSVQLIPDVHNAAIFHRYFSCPIL